MKKRVHDLAIVDPVFSLNLQSVQEQTNVPYDIISIGKVYKYDIEKLMFSQQLLTSYLKKYRVYINEI